MDKSASSSSSTETPAVIPPKEKILFETQPLLIPTILNIETLTIVGFTVVIVIFAAIFHLGAGEFLIIAALYLLIAVPSLRQIFMAGSTTYVLTNQRLIIFTVGFGPKERSIPLEQIQDLKYRASGLQRFYGAGEIIVHLKGLRKSVRLFGLKDVKRRTEQIQSAAKKAQNKA